MPVRITQNVSDGYYYVEWREADNFTRERSFATFAAALRFSSQVECRLLLESMTDLRPHRCEADPLMSMNKSSALMTEQEVADLLHVKACTVRNERVRGKLGFTRVGKEIWITVRQLNRYLEGADR